MTPCLCLQVAEETVADDDMIMLKGCKSTRAVTVLLRGANDYMLDEMDRSLHDAFCIVKRVLESGTVVPGTSCLCSQHAAYLMCLKAWAQQGCVRQRRKSLPSLLRNTLGLLPLSQHCLLTQLKHYKHTLLI